MRANLSLRYIQEAFRIQRHRSINRQQVSNYLGTISVYSRLPLLAHDVELTLLNQENLSGANRWAAGSVSDTPVFPSTSRTPPQPVRGLKSPLQLVDAAGRVRHDRSRRDTVSNLR